MHREPSDIRLYIVCIVFFFVGISYFFWGFRRLRLKRLIENIPTSTVRGLALGLTELVGKAKARGQIWSPFTNTECVFYKFTVEQYKHRGKSGNWALIAEGNTGFHPFYIDDDTARVLVSPEDAELIIPIDYEITTGFGNPIPDNLIYFMEKNGLRHKGFFGSYRLRFKEWYICPDEKIYVLGTAKISNIFLKEHNEELDKRLEQIKRDSSGTTEVDLNKDGEVSIEEWDIAFAKTEKELLEAESKTLSQDDLSDIVIGVGGIEKTFVISDSSQSDLIETMSLSIIMSICGGIALSLISLLFFLLMLFGVINF